MLVLPQIIVIDLLPCTGMVLHILPLTSFASRMDNQEAVDLEVKSGSSVTGPSQVNDSFSFHRRHLQGLADFNKEQVSMSKTRLMYAV